jgi:hypothetical protein
LLDIYIIGIFENIENRLCVCEKKQIEILSR